MTQASADEDGVSWIEEAGGPTCTETVTSMDSAANLTPAEVSNFRRRPKWLHKNQTTVHWQTNFDHPERPL